VRGVKAEKGGRSRRRRGRGGREKVPGGDWRGRRRRSNGAGGRRKVEKG